jgi:hypothetical protein
MPACYLRPVADLPSACVIGAGSSGIAALEALRRELKAGARRPGQAGFGLPVAPRAGEAAAAAPSG